MAVRDSAASPRTCCSAPCCTEASTAQTRRRRDELDSDGTAPRVVAPAAPRRHITEQSASDATGYLGVLRPTTLENDGSMPAGHGPTTTCAVMEATVALGTFEGVSGYSFRGNDLANMPPPLTAPFHLQQASSGVHERDQMPPLPDRGRAASTSAVQVTTPSTTQHTRCEVLRLVESDCSPARQQHDIETISQEPSRLHTALRAQCTKLLQQNHTYADIEEQLLSGMCAKQWVRSASAKTKGLDYILD